MSLRLLCLLKLGLVVAVPMTANPPNTLLLPGVTSVALQLTTDSPTACRWAPTDVPYAGMPNFFTGDGSTVHATTLTGLFGNVSLSVFYVQCEAYSSSPSLILSYRSLPDSGNAPFPRLGNLWGSGNFRGHPEGIAYAASRASLWLGSDWSEAEIAELRQANAYTLVTTSINACETNMQNLPDAYYLTNITQPPSTKGRLQSWPGAWRLDLTNSDVQAYLASLMYCLVIYGGSGYGSNPGCNNATIPPMLFDGLFIDNVFLDDGAAVNSQDIFHNPFIPMDRATGKPMVDFNAKWRSGMLATLNLFRASMPHAIMDGHAMDIGDSDVAALFNAISIGFTTPQIIERFEDFADGFATYATWMSAPAHEPRVTMVESAVRFQLGYGFGFDHDLQTAIATACVNSHTASDPGAPMPGIGDACHALQPPKLGYMPPETYLRARSEYAYMRFGLGFTLMRDGYFTHELGDSWHGMDWDYDELHFVLGAAAGDAAPAQVLSPLPPPAPPAIPLTEPWGLYVRSPDTANASWALDTTIVPFAGAPPSARIDVAGTAPSADGIDLSQVIDGMMPAGGYLLSFWARASVEGAPVHLNARKNGGDWHSFGLDSDVVFGLAWQQVNVTFTSSADGSAARLSWWVGRDAPGTSLWVNSPTLVGAVLPLPVLAREFACGAVVLNGHTSAVTVRLNTSAPLRRLVGAQAPRWQLFFDDNTSAFTPTSGAWAPVDLDNGYHGATTPSQEEVRPANGFWQHWGAGAHVAPAGATATFALSVPETGIYNLSLWWPQAVPARAGWATAMRVTISPGGSGTTLDLTSQGGNSFYPIAANVQLTPASVLTLECPAGGGACVADAVLVESEARYNDGADADTVTLQPMDAVVLANKSPPPGCAHAGFN